MQSPENDELSERELDAILPEWKTPMAPARLRTAVFPEALLPWWSRVWGASVRVPLPVACGVAILLALAAWRWSTPRTIYRERIVPVSVAAGADELRPVTVLRPRIIRSANAQN